VEAHKAVLPLHQEEDEPGDPAKDVAQTSGYVLRQTHRGSTSTILLIALLLPVVRWLIALLLLPIARLLVPPLLSIAIIGLLVASLLSIVRLLSITVSISPLLALLSIALPILLATIRVCRLWRSIASILTLLIRIGLITHD
jgi:hypothetical protein